MEIESGDATNDEWVVDGDLYLIQTISRFPILWDRKNFDSDQRNEVWLKLSKKLNIELEWMKKRWSYLREQYVKHLKKINNLESDTSSKKNYKYFNEMSFLASHIQIRNGNHQDVISHIPYGGESNGRVEIETTDQIEGLDDIDRDNGDGSECVDFVITENEIQAYNDDDDENMFVELSEEEDDSIVQSIVEPSALRNVMKLATPTKKSDVKSVADIPAKQTQTGTVVFEDSLELRNSEQHLSTDSSAEDESPQKTTKVTESRCEDVIFGELVTSMLKRMDSPDRKRAKKEILNILLS